MSELYKYSSIDGEKGEFRVLVLEPSPREWTMICCRLETTNVATKTQYCAVSYTWGDPRMTHRILIDGKQHLVTKNVNSFLKRQRAQSNGQQRLWIDSLCINQPDNEEKRHQINLMKDIYLGTAQLLIWLGEKDDWSDYAMGLLKECLLWSRTTRPPMLDDWQMDAFRRLFERPWWNRVWIMQELLLGARRRQAETAVVICGAKRTTWVAVVKAMHHLRHWNAYQRQQFPFIASVLDLEHLRLGYDRNSFDDPRSLNWWLLKTRNREATDERDKLYGLRGIVDPADGLISLFQLDYGLSNVELYTLIATRLIQGSVGIELLRQCGNQRIDGLPTWVPDWSAKNSVHPLWNAANAEDQGRRLYLTRKFHMSAIAFDNGKPVAEKIPTVATHYWTGKDKTQEVHVASDMSSLEAVGIRFDRVKDCGSPPFVTNLAEKWFKTTFFMMQVSNHKKYLDNLLNVPNPYGGVEEREEAFWRALLADHDRGGKYKPKINPEDYLQPIPSDWRPQPLVISATEEGTWRLVKLQSNLLLHVVAYFLKSTGRKLGGRNWAEFEVKDAGWMELLSVGGFNIERSVVRIGDVDLDRSLIEKIVETCKGATDLTPERIKYYCEEAADFITARPLCDGKYGYIQRRNHLIREGNRICELWCRDHKHDLVNSPFKFENTIPDPWHHMREDVRLEYKGDDCPTKDERELWSETKTRWISLKCSGYSMGLNRPGSPRYALGRRFIVTEKGYLGIAPPETEKGDIVAVFPGCNTPILLRPCEDRVEDCFTVVGEAHVQGIMDGEVIEKWKNGDIETRHFKLI